jgi:beta-glucosidase
MDRYARFRYQPCLPLGEDGTRVTASQKHISLSRKAAGEGMVLLKNNNKALPLASGEKIALFGKATIEYIKGGGGSGDVHCPYIKNIFEGFKDKEGWQILVKRAMECDYSWGRSAGEYIKMYKEILKG